MTTRVSVLGVVLLLGGCGGGSDSICASACNKMHGCGLDKIHITAVNAYTFLQECSAVECDKTTACVSSCFMDATCSDLQQVVLGGKLHTCLVACNNWFRVPDAGL